MKQHLYYETLDWVTYWKNFFRQDKGRFLKALKDDFQSQNIFLTNAGRAGIILSLKAFGLRREDEVLVPRFMSTCVLDSVNQIASPSLNLTERTKAVLFYHHWGYPQNYSKAENILRPKKIRIIEDCAHGLWGKSQGRALGSFGDTAIFSLSKIFEMTYAGALKVNDVSLLGVIEKELSRAPSVKECCESLLGEWEYLNYYNTPLKDREHQDMQIDLLKWYATLLVSFPLATVRGRLPRSAQEIQQVFQRQNKHFLTLLKNARHRFFILPLDEEETMAPMCFPILSSDEVFLKEVQRWLSARNIFTGIYHFDVNRNMFEPDYRKCVPVPLYASLPDHIFDDFIRDFKGRY
ncbi:MAG: DegT/DnrJ/EryC1/StrS family aminotransferase [Candidatus Omnitrophota bacterium]